MAEDFYTVLSVGRLASNSEIARAYRLLALQYHPDKNTDPTALTSFLRISEAYNTLKNEDTRMKYDFQQSVHSLFDFVRKRPSSDLDPHLDQDDMEYFTITHSDNHRCKICSKPLLSTRPRFHFLTEHFSDFRKWKLSFKPLDKKRRKTTMAADIRG